VVLATTETAVRTTTGLTGERVVGNAGRFWMVGRRTPGEGEGGGVKPTKPQVGARKLGLASTTLLILFA